jgi:hypothetical protein
MIERGVAAYMGIEKLIILDTKLSTLLRKQG